MDKNNIQEVKLLEQATDLIGSSKKIFVLTGAGISTDSGIPDFRGPKGVWTLNPGAEKASNIRYWISDPDIRKARWKGLLKRKQSGAPERQANAGHLALAKLQRTGKLRLLATQNVDGLHTKAGNTNVIEVHGNLKQTKCLKCGDVLPIDDTIARVAQGDEDPHCLKCGGLLKSATISFGQSLVAEDIQAAMDAARDCDLMIAVGTTLGVYPIAGVVPIASQLNVPIIILNGSPTELDHLATIKLTGSISDILPRMVVPAVESKEKIKSKI